MPPDLLRRWAALNGLTVAAEGFGLHALADNPPAGADQVRNPNAENAICLIDAEGRPAGIVFHSFGGQWMREAGDICRWMKLSAFRPPAPRDEADRHFVVVGRAGAVEPKWLPEQQ